MYSVFNFRQKIEEKSNINHDFLYALYSVVFALSIENRKSRG